MTETFVTKDSGERILFSTGMQRDTSQDKPRFDLIIPEDQNYRDTLLYRWAMLMGRGAEKYDDRNWEKAKTQEELNRFKESAYRHFMQWFADEGDEDHASAILFNVNGAEYVRNRLDKNE